MFEELKKRFLTWETLEGQTYLWAGGALFLGYIFGLFQIILNASPFIAVVLIVIGAYKTFIKRENTNGEEKSS